MLFMSIQHAFVVYMVGLPESQGGRFKVFAFLGTFRRAAQLVFRNHFHLPISYLLICFLFQTKPRVLSPCGLAGCFV